MERKPTVRAPLRLLLVLLDLFLSCHAMSRDGYSLIQRPNALRRRMEDGKDSYINNSEDTGEVTRLLIQPFSVQLTGASETFASSDLNALYSVMNQVVSDYVLVTKQTTNVSYILLGDISSALSDARAIELFLNTGALRMDAATDTMPDETTLNTWVGEAIDQNFATALQGTSYSYVTEASYVRDGATDGDEGTNNVPPDDTDTSGIVNDSVTTTTSKSSTGMIAGSAVAAVTVLGLLAVLFIERGKRRSRLDYIEQQNSKDDSTFPEVAPKNMQSIFVTAGSDEEKLQGNSPAGLTLALSQLHQGIVSNSSGLSISTASTDHSEPTPTMQIVNGKAGILGAVPMVLDDGKSLDGNDSDFTVNTEAGDSTAVKSLPPQKLYYPKDVFSKVERESFERDRQVCIRKDMMTSTWSGGTQHPQPPQNESVLEPSHLTASQARQERRPREDDLLVFEQANYEASPPVNSRTPPSQISRMTRNGDAV